MFSMMAASSEEIFLGGYTLYRRENHVGQQRREHTPFLAENVSPRRTVPSTPHHPTAR